MISVSGQGNEPKLDFSSTLIEFGPVLPHSSGDEKEVIVRNPSSFPVEIYSLEFDKQYLEEEKVQTKNINVISSEIDKVILFFWVENICNESSISIKH